MNGIHDLGGMHGMGPVNPETDEPVFRADWERRVFGLMMAIPGDVYNIDEFRHTIERMGAAEYLSTSYYEHWLHCLEVLMVEKGQIKRAELEAAWSNASRAASGAA